MGIDFDHNRELILAHERSFAGRIAGEVVDRPQLAMWMILIPIFFVFYFFQFKRYKSGLQDFRDNFLVSRNRVVDAVHAAARSGDAVDIDALVAASSSPDESKDRYRAWIEALVEHGRIVMHANGDSYADLVRSGYRSKSSYQIVMRRLNQVEQDFHRSLAGQLPGDDERIGAVIEAMERSTARLRRAEADDFFS